RSSEFALEGVHSPWQVPRHGSNSEWDGSGLVEFSRPSRSSRAVGSPTWQPARPVKVSPWRVNRSLAMCFEHRLTFGAGPGGAPVTEVLRSGEDPVGFEPVTDAERFVIIARNNVDELTADGSDTST